MRRGEPGRRLAGRGQRDRQLALSGGEVDFAVNDCGADDAYEQWLAASEPAGRAEDVDPDDASRAGAITAGANRTFLVPAVLAQVLQSGPEAIALFGRLETYIDGAAPMPLPLLRAAIQAWPDTDFLQVYGLTEVAGVATHLPPDEHHDPDHPERLVSAGRRAPGVEVRIVDPATTQDVATGEPGEIWLRTGDVGRVDEDGSVFVEDRLKDIIISGGQNIDSPEVERVLAEHPGHRRGDGHRRARRDLGGVGQGGRLAAAAHPADRRGAGRLVLRAPRALQVPAAWSGDRTR